MVIQKTMNNYYNELCTQWGYTSPNLETTGYESVYPDLMKLTKERWSKENDTGKLQIEQEVFDIYRAIDVLPITYYSIDGCKEQIKTLRGRSPKIKDRKIPVGNTAGLGLSRFWFPNMQEATTAGSKTVSLHSRFNDDKKLRRAIKLCYKHRDEGEKTVLPINIRRALELVSGGTIQNFKPLNATAIWEYICPTMFGRVLDFSSGYGGRMLGAMTSGMRYHYTGIDPNTKTYNGLVALGDLINDVIGTEYEMHHCGSEDYNIIPDFFDAAFSSPPYFNLEIYSDEPTQCMNKYLDRTAWFEHYVEPTLIMLRKGLTHDGIYAVNIADYNVGKNQFQIVDHWIEMSEKLGFKHEETVHMMLNVRPGVGNNKTQNGYKSEGVYIFRKTASLTG
jgi:hypothetical protein